jgi:hypothetical protein
MQPIIRASCQKSTSTTTEIAKWKTVADKMYLPYSEEHDVYFQQDGFLDKELVKVSDLDKSQRPINQKWSWDRILRSPYIKQADVLAGILFLRRSFSTEQLENISIFTSRLPCMKAHFPLACIRSRRRFWAKWIWRIRSICAHPDSTLTITTRKSKKAATLLPWPAHG